MPPGKLKSIDIHSYRTPPANNDGNDYYSVGVLNVTADEAGMIKAFAQMVQRARGNPDVGSITIPVTGVLRVSTTTTGEFTENVRPVRGVSGPAPLNRVVIDNITRVSKGVPNDDVGFDNDTYMNSANGTLYQRINGVYQLRGTIMEQEYDTRSNSFKVTLAEEEKPKPAAKQKKLGGRFSGLDLDGD